MSFTGIAGKAGLAAFAAVLGTGLFSGCGGAETPEEVAEAYFEAFLEGDGRGAMEFAYLPEERGAEGAEDGKQDQMSHRVKVQVDNKGGIQSITARDLVVHEPNERGEELGIVMVDIATNDGMVHTERVRLIKVGGKWLVKL